MWSTSHGPTKGGQVLFCRSTEGRGTSLRSRVGVPEVSFKSQFLRVGEKEQKLGALVPLAEDQGLDGS